MFKPYSDSPVESPESNSPAVTVPKALREKESSQATVTAAPAAPQEVVSLELLKLAPPDESWKREAFVLDRRNNALIAGRTRQVPGNGALFMLFLGLAFSIIFWIPELAERSTIWAFETNGIRVNATVISRRISVSRSSKSTTTTYYVTYTFRTKSEAQYRVEEAVSYNVYARATTGAQLPVAYLPDNPRATRLIDNQRTSNWGLVALIFSLVGVPVALAGWVMRRTNVRLSKYGQIIRGDVVKASGSRTKNGYTVSVEYTFKGADGHIMTGRGYLLRNDLSVSKALPQPGTPVYVLYDGNKTHRML